MTYFCFSLVYHYTCNMQGLKWVTSLDHLCGPLFSLILSIHISFHFFLLFNVWNWNYHPFVFVEFGFGGFTLTTKIECWGVIIWWQQKWGDLLCFIFLLKSVRCISTHLIIKCEVYIQFNSLIIHPQIKVGPYYAFIMRYDILGYPILVLKHPIFVGIL